MRDRSVFQQAIEISDGAEREAFVRQACDDDEQLAEQVFQLLGAATAMGDFLESSVLEQVAGPAAPAGKTESPIETMDDETADHPPGPEHLTSPNSFQQLQPYLAPTNIAGMLGQLGNYAIERVLGEGGFGIVLQARDLRLERSVAIKVLLPSLTSNALPRRRFLNEARATAAIRHPNVIGIYSVEEEPIPYLVMELLSGRTLQDWIDDGGPADVSVLLQHGRQLLAGLAAAHAAGLVHRDIKPSNVLVDEASPPQVKLGDFGLARSLTEGDLTRTGCSAGTPLYMSPEQALGQWVDGRSDLFSAASTLYAVATGRAPFRGLSSLAVMKEVAEGTPRPIREIAPDVPTWVEAILNKMHAKLPLDRFESAQTAYDLWQACEEAWRRTGELPPKLHERLLKLTALTRPTSDEPTDTAVAEPPPAVPSPSPSPDQNFPVIHGDSRPSADTESAPCQGSGGDTSRPKTASSPDRTTIPELQVEPRRANYRAAGVLLGMLAVASLFLLDHLERNRRHQAIPSELAAVDVSGLSEEPARPDRIERGEREVAEPIDSQSAGESANPLENTIATTVADATELTRTEANLDSGIAEAERPTAGDAATPDREPATSVVQVAAAADQPASQGRLGGWGDDAPPFAVVPFSAEQAAEFAQLWADHLRVPVEWTHPLGIRFRLIPPGEFEMGIDEDEIEKLLPQILPGPHLEACLRSESPRHRVVLTKPFYLSVHEISQQQFERLMKHNPSSYRAGTGLEQNRQFPDGLDLSTDPGQLPVERVTWFEAANFCRQLSLRDGWQPVYEFVDEVPRISYDAIGYRLPTEAEWEFACLAGSSGPFATGDDPAALYQMANVENRFGSPLPIGSLPPNAFGIHDLHGNVNEWVQDTWSKVSFAASREGIAIDPTGPRQHGWRVTRGGDYLYNSVNARAAARLSAIPHQRHNYPIGFRIAAPVQVKRGVPEPAYSDAKILTGAMPERLLDWAKQLGPDYLPIALNPRHGTQPTLIDAIAVPNEHQVPWQLNLVEDANAEFQAMHKSYRAAWRMPVQCDSDESMRTLFLWVADVRSWWTWQGPREFILERAHRLEREPYQPNSWFGFYGEQDENWLLTMVLMPGAKVETHSDVAKEELAQLIEEYRARGWRPIRLMQHIGFASPRFAVLFRDNPTGLKWLYEEGLSEEEAGTRDQQYREQGLLPTLIASRLQEDGVLRYRVVWTERRSE